MDNTHADAQAHGKWHGNGGKGEVNDGQAAAAGAAGAAAVAATDSEAAGATESGIAGATESGTASGWTEWAEAFDAGSGELYYYHTLTGNTQWEPPRGWGQADGNHATAAAYNMDIAAAYSTGSGGTAQTAGVPYWSSHQQQQQQQQQSGGEHWERYARREGAANPVPSNYEDPESYVIR
jgi:hypothetical protein